MNKPSNLLPARRRILIASIMLILVGQACTLSLFKNPIDSGSVTPIPVNNVPTSTPQPVAQTNFVVTLPEPLGLNETLVISIMDEVTGLSLNAVQYPMSARDSLTTPQFYLYPLTPWSSIAMFGLALPRFWRTQA